MLDKEFHPQPVGSLTSQRREIPLREALLNAAHNRNRSYWPAGPDNRLSPLYTPILHPRFRLQRGTRIFTIGSCFARNIEEELGRLGYDVPALGLSVPKEEYNPAPSIVDKFTPLSALQELERTLVLMRTPERAEQIIDDLLFPATDGRMIDLELREYVPVSRERAHERRRDIFNVFRHAFDCDCVVITLGLVECWMDLTTGRAIQETPHALALRRAEDRFALKVMTYAEVLDASERMIRLLIENGRPGVKIMLTVSPVPMRATFTAMDVVLANSYSKATLRSAAQEIRSRYEQVDYFPSYEMVTLSTVPGIWNPDLIHVTPEFVGRVIDVMVANYITDPAARLIAYRTVHGLETPYRAHPPLGWYKTLPAEFMPLCDGRESVGQSPLRLFENELELGPPHRAYKQITQLGGGAYCFYAGYLFFSTSDGSDPSTNGRVYTVRMSTDAPMMPAASAG